VSVVRDFEFEQPERPQGSELFIPRKAERRSSQAVARGSLACPSCDVPVVSGGRIPILARIRCPFCREIHPARSFVRLDALDTTLNEIQVVARLR